MCGHGGIVHGTRENARAKEQENKNSVSLCCVYPLSLFRYFVFSLFCYAALLPMIPLMHPFQFAIGEMGVDLSSGDALMPQQLLHRADISPPQQQISGK